MKTLLVILMLLAGVGSTLSCKDAMSPDSIDPYALFYIRNDRTNSPIYYMFVRFPNRNPIEDSFIGSVGSGEETCGSFGLDVAIEDDPANMVQLVVKMYQGDSVTNPVVDTLKSPTVHPFGLGANTTQTPHRFRLWFKEDGTTFFDFGLYNESEKWAQEPGWPCPETF